MAIKRIILLAIELQNVFGSLLIKPLPCSTSSVNSLDIFPLFNLPVDNTKLLAGVEGWEAKREIVSHRHLVANT